jgi:PhoH-like ATPase
MLMKTNASHKAYVLDTNVLIHDPMAILQFEEHHVVIPMTVLEELDHLKSGKRSIAADCRSAIRIIDLVLSDAEADQIQSGVPIHRDDDSECGYLSVATDVRGEGPLADGLNDNKIINTLIRLRDENPDTEFVLVTKDINMRIKAKANGVKAEDYHNDQLISDMKQLNKGFHRIEGSFWDAVTVLDSFDDAGSMVHQIKWTGEQPLYMNQFVLDSEDFVGRVIDQHDNISWIRGLSREAIMHQEAWGLRPINLFQGLALHLLLDPDVHLVTLTGAAGSGKTILALAAAIEMTVEQNLYSKIIVTRSTPPLAEELGFLPGTEEEKMDPWLGAINDNIEALHENDDNPNQSIAYVKQKANIQFKAMNYIRGRSFQHSLIMIDECQNLTPYQMKAIITRAGEGSKVICLGNLAQIDGTLLTPTSSGLTYMTERFKGFKYGGSVHLSGVPRSPLAEFAETNL